MQDMLTQIEIDGFKTFKNFKIELAPFQVIVGPNGSGKSNLFDALQLLSRLAEMDLYSAFQGLRGNTGEAFTKYADGQTSERIWIAVEMLVDRKVRDDLGREFEIEHTRLRYELEIAQNISEDGPDQLYIKNELLKRMPIEEDNWYKTHKIQPSTNLSEGKLVNDGLIFSFAQNDKKNSVLKIHHMLPKHLYEGENSQNTTEKMDEIENFSGTLSRTILSSSTIASMHHAIAARTELRSLKMLHLNPDVLRQYCSVKAPYTLASDGSNLPAVLARMQKEDKYVLGDISRDMVNLVPGIHKIRVEKNKLSDQYIIQAKTSDQRSFSSQVLSDGILRLLALTTLKYDTQFRGVLCLEEPENGVDPLHLPNTAHLLHSMATNFDDPDQLNKPLRQVLITTHSPAFISLPEVIDSLIFALKITHVEPGKNSLHITRMVPVFTSDVSAEEEDDLAAETYTINQVRKYLDSGSFDKARSRLATVKPSENSA
jgi:predicted ATPase